MPPDFAAAIGPPLGAACVKILIDYRAREVVIGGPGRFLVFGGIATEAHLGLKLTGIRARYGQRYRFGVAERNAALFLADAVAIDPGSIVAVADAQTEAGNIVVPHHVIGLA